jgi:quercetin dioxygenase-like cupin family protein
MQRFLVCCSAFISPLVVTLLYCVALGQTAPRGLVLGPDDGEKRYYPGAKEAIVIKVDPVNGGSKHMVLESALLGVGEYIPVHRHLYVDEILFVHRGNGAVYLAGRRAQAQEGSTIFIPADTWIGLKNTGTTPLSVVAIFSAPGFEQRQRLVTVGVPGAKLTLSDAQLARINNQYGVEYRYDIPVVLPSKSP